jgi:hypothetical protein
VFFFHRVSVCGLAPRNQVLILFVQKEAKILIINSMLTIVAAISMFRVIRR